MKGTKERTRETAPHWETVRWHSPYQKELRRHLHLCQWHWKLDEKMMAQLMLVSKYVLHVFLFGTPDASLMEFASRRLTWGEWGHASAKAMRELQIVKQD